MSMTQHIHEQQRQGRYPMQQQQQQQYPYQQQQQQLQSTRYGVTIAVIKDKGIYMSRRSERLVFGKKWQFVNGRMKGAEVSRDAAVRLMETEMGITIDKDRLYDVAENIEVPQTGEFYYVYLVHLKSNECPMTYDEGDAASHGPWRLFPMEASVVLDLVPGIRDVVRKLKRTLNEFENPKQSPVLTAAEMAEANRIYDEQRVREEQQAFHSMDFHCGC